MSGFQSSCLKKAEAYLPTPPAGFPRSGSTATLFLPGLRACRNPSTCCHPRVEGRGWTAAECWQQDPQLQPELWSLNNWSKRRGHRGTQHAPPVAAQREHPASRAEGSLRDPTGPRKWSQDLAAQDPGRRRTAGTAQWHLITKPPPEHRQQGEQRWILRATGASLREPGRRWGGVWRAPSRKKEGRTSTHLLGGDQNCDGDTRGRRPAITTYTSEIDQWNRPRRQPLGHGD